MTWCQVQLEGCEGRAAHQHHRKLRKHGGDNAEENLLSLCLHCHTWIHMHPLKSYEKGWLVHSWALPEEVKWESAKAPI